MQTRLRPTLPHSADASVSPAAPVRRTAAETVARVLAVLTIVLIAMRVQGPMNIAVGPVVALALVPCWWSSVRRFAGAMTLMVTTVIAVGCGAWLTVAASAHHEVSFSVALANSTMVLGIATGVGVVIWARGLMSDAHIAQWAGIGLLLGVSPSSSLFSSNPWKFGFALAVTVIALALAQRSGKRWLEIATLVVLGLVNAATDGRSSFAILLLAAALVAWQARPRSASVRGRASRVVIGFAVVSLVAFNLGQAAILDGYLGQATQLRSQQQIDVSGSLILGGRPELAATVALMLDSPLGFGSGVVPNYGEVNVAKAGMYAIGYNPNNGYVENYLFGDGVELHSLIGDFWAHFGIMGLVLIGVIIFIVVRGLAQSIAQSAASGVLCFLAIRTLWNIGFSPLYSSVVLTTFALGLLLLERDGLSASTRSGGRRRAEARREGMS